MDQSRFLGEDNSHHLVRLDHHRCP